MDQVWFVAALWLLLALVGAKALGGKAPWIAFLAGTGAILLTFLAGAELDPVIFRTKWKESMAVGLVGFAGPFAGAAMVAHYLVGSPVLPCRPHPWRSCMP